MTMGLQHTDSQAIGSSGYKFILSAHDTGGSRVGVDGSGGNYVTATDTEKNYQ